MVRGSASSHPVSDSDIESYFKSQVVLTYSNAVTVSTTFTPDNHPGSIVTFSLFYSFAPFLFWFRLLHHNQAQRLVANDAGGATCSRRKVALA